MAKRSIRKTAGSGRKSTSGKGGWVTALLLIALGGGGYYGYGLYQQKENERRAEEEARRARIAADKRLAEEMARLAAEKAEQERLAAEQAERDRLAAEEEARRRAAEEEAERRRRLRESLNNRKKTDTGSDEPDEEPETPQGPTMYDEQLPMHGADANSISTRKQFDTMVDNLLEKRDFDAFEQAMSAKIKEGIQAYTGNGKLNYGQYKNNRNLMQAVDLCLLIQMAGQKEMDALAAIEGDDNDNNGVDFLRWALRDKTRPLHLFLQSYLAQEGQDENMAHSLNLFYQIWKETEEKSRPGYLNLMVAGALMSPQVCENKGMYRDPDAMALSVPEVCAYLREMDGKRKLVTDIKKLSVSQLIHVVNVRLPQSEFDWACENTSYSQANWGDSLGSIEYLMDRATKGKDPYENYSFEEIRKEGGICMDQAYFACNTGKCRGVPTVYVSGDGDRGPHAWMLNLVDANSWVQTNSTGYNSGRFTNPCSGRQQHAATLLNKDSKTTDTKLIPATDAMILADYLTRIGCSAEAHAAARYVTGAFPNETVSWAHFIKVLGHDEKNLPPVSVWRKIDSDLIRLSKKNSELLDIAAEVEDKYLLSGKNAASKQMAMRRSMSQLEKRGGDDRADLVLSAVERQAVTYKEAGNLTGLALLYRKQLKKYSKRGDIFGDLLEQYMQILGDDASPRAWTTLAKDAEKLFEKHVQTNGSDFFKLKKEVQIQQFIASAWAKAGNERKAKKLLEMAEERLQEGVENNSSGEDEDD